MDQTVYSSQMDEYQKNNVTPTYILKTIPVAVFWAEYRDYTWFKSITLPVETITGYPPSFFIDEPNSLESLLSSADIRYREQAIAASLQDGTPYQVVYRFIRADGEPRWLAEWGSPYRGHDNSWLIEGAIGDVTRDRSGPATYQRKDRIDRRIFDAVVDLIVTIDDDHRILEINKAMADLLDLTPDECIGRYCHDIFPCTPEWCLTCPHTKAMEEERPQVDEISELVPGTTYQVSSSPYIDSQEMRKGCTHIFHDISIRKQQQQSLQDSEKKIREMNQELKETQDELRRVNAMLNWQIMQQSDELKALSAEVLDRNRMVEHLLSQKDRFINQIAHDLRTPITPVLALLPMIQERISDPYLQEILTLFEMRLGYLREMSEDVIRYAHLNSQTYINDYSPFMVHTLIEETFSVYNTMAFEKQITLINCIPPELQIWLSKSQAPLLFHNLIENAIQYNTVGGTVTVGGKDENGWASITFTDTGVGIPPERSEQIWEEFTTGDPSRSDPLHKGFGLPLVKRIVTMHRGYIIASSQGADCGTTFSLTLPLVPIPDT